MKRAAIIATVLILVLVPTALLLMRQMPSERATPKIGPFHEYRNPTKHFSVQAPVKWTTRDGDDGVYFSSPLEGQADIVRENINISFEEGLPDGMTLDAYSVQAESQVTSLEGYRLVSSDKGSIGDAPARGMTYEATLQGTVLHVQQLWTIHDDRAVILTLAAEPSTFSVYSRVLKRMARSFVLLAP